MVRQRKISNPLQPRPMNRGSLQWNVPFVHRGLHPEPSSTGLHQCQELRFSTAETNSALQVTAVFDAVTSQHTNDACRRTTRLQVSCMITVAEEL